MSKTIQIAFYFRTFKALLFSGCDQGGWRGGVGRIHVWLCVFEGVGTNWRAELEAFFLVTKVRRYGRITGVKNDTNSNLLSYL